ncbi:MAG: F0F1 ATP synthase subunit delta [Beijerinckiaceae bacterium]
MAKEETLVSGMSGRYAQALFELAKESKTTDQVAADLAGFRALLAESSDLVRFVKSPVFTAAEQVAALGAILTKAGIAGQAAKFLKLVATKRRLFAIEDMIAGYERLYDASRGVTRAEVTVAEPLKDAHVEALKSALVDVAGSQSVEVAIKVDPSILGGLIVKLGSRMVDSSLKTKLNLIRTRMKEVG